MGMPPWEQRMRSVIGNPKLPKVMSDDFVECFREIDSLRIDSSHVGNLAMLVRRLVRQMQKHDAENVVVKKAIDFLQRKGLAGSPLKEETT